MYIHVNKPFHYQSSINKNTVLQSAKKKGHNPMPNTYAFQIVWILSLAGGGNCGTGKRYVRKYPLSFVAVWVHMQSCKQANSAPDIQNLWLEIFIQLSFIELHISNRYGPLCYSLWVCVEELSSTLDVCLSLSWKKRLPQATFILSLDSIVTKTTQVWGTSSVAARMSSTFLSLLCYSIRTPTCGTSS